VEELERMRAEFLGMVSHELRTPLASIMGPSAAIMRSGADLDPAVVRQFVCIIGDVSLNWDDVAGAVSSTVLWAEIRDIWLRGNTSVESSDAEMTVGRYCRWSRATGNISGTPPTSTQLRPDSIQITGSTSGTWRLVRYQVE